MGKFVYHDSFPSKKLMSEKKKESIYVMKSLSVVHDMVKNWHYP